MDYGFCTSPSFPSVPTAPGTGNVCTGSSSRHHHQAYLTHDQGPEIRFMTPVLMPQRGYELLPNSGTRKARLWQEKIHVRMLCTNKTLERWELGWGQTSPSPRLQPSHVQPSSFLWAMDPPGHPAAAECLSCPITSHHDVARRDSGIAEKINFRQERVEMISLNACTWRMGSNSGRGPLPCRAILPWRGMLPSLEGGTWSPGRKSLLPSLPAAHPRGPAPAI